MKRLLVFILLLVFSLQFTGFYIYYAFRLTEIRREVRSQLKFLPEEKLERFVLTHDQFMTARHGDDELRLQGKMYDIARMESANDSLIIFALHDEAEDNLLSLLTTVVKRTNTDKKPLPLPLFSLLALVYLPATFSYSAAWFNELGVLTPYFDFFTETCTVRLFQPPKC
jgi:hypothetical protein